jgi:hypothetical protein
VGNEGTAITLVGYGEITDFNNIKALTKTEIEQIQPEQDLSVKPLNNI